MGHILAGILQLPPLLVLALVFVFPALEASVFLGFLVAGEIGIVLGGVLANQGKLPLWAVLVAAVAGAIIGDTVGYLVGRRYGARILRRLPSRLIDEAKIERAGALLRRWGGRAVFIGRFTAALRALVPGMAGMSRIRYRTFSIWNAAGGTVWAVAYVLLGYLAGSQYEHIEKYANYVGTGLVIVVVITLIVRHRTAKVMAARAMSAAEHR